MKTNPLEEVNITSGISVTSTVSSDSPFHSLILIFMMSKCAVAVFISVCTRINVLADVETAVSF